MSGKAERAKRAGYMESAVEFSCGTCAYRGARQGTNARTHGRLVLCLHPKIRQPVDADFGCCNKFVPKHPDDLVFTAARIETPAEGRIGPG